MIYNITMSTADVGNTELRLPEQPESTEPLHDLVTMVNAALSRMQDSTIDGIVDQLMEGQNGITFSRDNIRDAVVALSQISTVNTEGHIAGAEAALDNDTTRTVAEDRESGAVRWTLTSLFQLIGKNSADPAAFERKTREHLAYEEQVKAAMEG